MTSDPLLKANEIQARIVHLLETQNAMISMQNAILQNLATIQATQAQATQAQAQNKQAWKDSHPTLSKAAADALPILNQFQSTYMEKVLREVAEEQEALSDADQFTSQEFLDRHGQRIAHLQMLVQVVSFMGQ